MSDMSKAQTVSRSESSGFLSYQGREALTGWLMAAPVIIMLFTFLILPFIFAFGFSLTNQRLISPNPTEFVGLRNYQRLLTVRSLTLEPERDADGNIIRDEEGNIEYPRLRSFTRNNEEYPQLDGLREWQSWQRGDNRVYLLASDTVFLRALLNTFLFVLIVAPVQAGLALLLAVLINQPLRGVNIFRAIYFMPVIISIVIVGVLWSFIYDGQDGLLNTLLSAMTFGNFEGMDWLGNPRTALGAIMAMSIWQGVGFHMVIWLSGLQTIPFVLYEAASISGASALQKFRYVTWPGLRNTAVLILIVITMQAFALFTQIDVMTRGGPLDSTQSIVFQAVQRGFEKQDIAGGSAISVILFVLVLLVSIIQRYLTRER